MNINRFTVHQSHAAKPVFDLTMPNRTQFIQFVSFYLFIFAEYWSPQVAAAATCSEEVSQALHVQWEITWHRISSPRRAMSKMETVSYILPPVLVTYTISISLPYFCCALSLSYFIEFKFLSFVFRLDCNSNKNSKINYFKISILVFLSICKCPKQLDRNCIFYFFFLLDSSSVKLWLVHNFLSWSPIARISQ